MVVGTIFAGEVDELGGQSVKTKFFILGVPLIPLESYFVLENQGNGIRGFTIPMHGKSVLLAYARWGLGIGMVIAWIGALVDSHGSGSYLPGIFTTALWAAALFWAGRVGGAERGKRLLLGKMTGLFADPAILPTSVTDELIDGFKKKLQDDGVDPSPHGLDSAHDGLRLVAWAFAAYSAPRDPSFVEAEARLWESLAQVVTGLEAA